MLEQLDLFASLASEDKVKETPSVIKEPSPTIKDTTTMVTEPVRKLQPPVIVEIIEPDIPPIHYEVKKETIAKKSTRGRKSQKEMSLEVALVEVPDDDILFSKQYYGIGEVAGMFQVNTSLLRYWESEFDVLKPRKNRKGDRFFRPEDIKNLQLIHHLLRERKYTIEGAKDFFKKGKKAQEQFEAIEKLKKIKAFLLQMKAGLSD